MRGFTYKREAEMEQDEREQNREGETSKPPDDDQETQGPVDGPGKTAGADDLGETSQGEPGN
jgi:hypothetical protein